MKIMALLIALVCLAGCAALASHHGLAPPETVVYTPTDWPEALEADIYRPQGVGPFPGMLVVHGGGWERRSRSDMDRVAKHYAQQGYVVMNVSYRFAPEYRFPAPIHDLQQAMHWLHREAESLQLDRRRIAAMGYSAGAHLVSLLALSAGTGESLDLPWGGAETRPAVVVAGGSPMDLRKYPGGKLVPQFLGGRIEDIPEVFALASPVTHVHDQAPPFFLFHGGRDRLVTIDHAEEFVDALSASGVATTLYRQRGRGHVMAFLTVAGALEQSDRFLSEHL